MVNNKIDGAALLKITKSMFHTDNVSAAQLDYVLTRLDPISYLLKYYRPRSHKLTFNIPNFDIAEASRHRPWQVEPIRAITDPSIKEVNIQKGRQEGFSEVAVMSMLYLMDIYSYDAFKLLYAFPKLRGAY